MRRQGLARTFPKGRFDGVRTYVADHTIGNNQKTRNKICQNLDHGTIVSGTV
jgi:hypothetical protein